MNKNDMGIFLLCLFVFLALALSIGFFLIRDIRSSTKDLQNGNEDKAIQKEYIQSLKKAKKKKSHPHLEAAIDIIVNVILLLLVATSLYFTFTGHNTIGLIPQVKLVESGSMSMKYKDNTYLEENGLDNQFQKNDLIVIMAPPSIEDLKLYDIVLYESGNHMMIIHRIIDINVDNLGHKTFVTRGDANPTNDAPIEYNQIRGIYKDMKIPMIGHFVRFLKSPAGYLVLGLFIIVFLFAPSIDNKYDKIKRARLKKMGYKLDESDIDRKIDLNKAKKKKKDDWEDF